MVFIEMAGRKLEDTVTTTTRVLLFDAIDSGLSIDQVDDMKKYFFDVIVNTYTDDLYILVTANEYEMCVGYPCFNVTEGKYADADKVPTSASDPDYDATGYKGAEKTIDGHQVIIPPHVNGKIGAIQNVYGGGYGAKVDGDTYVEIGTKVGENIVFNTPFTKTVNDKEEDTTVADRTHEVKGVDIRGSIYGGGYGSTAVVTGNTNVQIGK
jgi:hypothetical protein